MWIGNNAIIMPGVSIGDGAVIPRERWSHMMWNHTKWSVAFQHAI